MITSSILVDKRVAVIGANGYLGSSLVSELIKKQYKVTRVSKKMGKTLIYKPDTGTERKDLARNLEKLCLMKPRILMMIENKIEQDSD